MKGCGWWCVGRLVKWLLWGVRGCVGWLGGLEGWYEVGLMVFRSTEAYQRYISVIPTSVAVEEWVDYSINSKSWPCCLHADTKHNPAAAPCRGSCTKRRVNEPVHSATASGLCWHANNKARDTIYIMHTHLTQTSNTCTETHQQTSTNSEQLFLQKCYVEVDALAGPTQDTHKHA